MPRPAFSSGRKSLLLAALTAIVIGGAWWWQSPPKEPVFQGRRISEVVFDPGFLSPGTDVPPADISASLKAFGSAGVKWLTFQVEHGAHGHNQSRSLPFDHAPPWLREWVSEKRGGLRPSPGEGGREAAAQALGLLGPAAAPAIPALIRSLSAEDKDFVAVVARTLNSLGPVSWPAIHEALTHGNASVRCSLLNTLEWRTTEEDGPEAVAALVFADLMQACDDPNAEVRHMAVGGIASYRRSQRAPALFDPAIPTLIRLLSDPNATVCASAAATLGSFRAKAAPAIPELVKCLNSADDHLAGTAARVLNYLGPLSWPAVREALEHGSVVVRKGLGGSMFQRVCDKAEPAPDAEVDLVVVALAKGCGDPDAGVRGQVIESILACRHFRPDTTRLDPVIPALIPLLSDANPEVRRLAAVAMAKFDVKTPAAVARLRAMTHDSNSTCQMTARGVLKAFGVSAEAESTSDEIAPPR